MNFQSITRRRNINSAWVGWAESGKIICPLTIKFLQMFGAFTSFLCFFVFFFVEPLTMHYNYLFSCLSSPIRLWCLKGSSDFFLFSFSFLIGMTTFFLIWFFKVFYCIFPITIYPPYIPPPNHHTVVHVHESLFFFVQSLLPLPSPTLGFPDFFILFYSQRLSR